MNYLRSGLVFVLVASYGWAAPTPLVPGSRVQAFSGAFTGLADDANAIFFNPAGIAFHRRLSSDISFWRTDDGKLGGASVMYINPSTASQTMAGIGWTGIGLSSATANERAGAFVIPTIYSPVRSVPLGLGLKLVYDQNASGDLKWRGTIDAGTMLEFGEVFRIGAVARNIIRTRLEAFPSLFAAGASLTAASVFAVVIEGDALSMDEVKNGDANYAAGLELQPFMFAIFRGGVRLTPDTTYYSMGVELKQSLGSGIAVGYWFPSDGFKHGWFSLGFAYRIG